MKILNKKVPESWAEISIRQFQELSTLKLSSEQLELDDILDVLAIVLDTTGDELDTLQFDVLNQIDLSFISEEPKSLPNSKEIKIKGETYVMMDNFNLMSMGEFYDLETYIKDEKGHISNLHKILAILYTKKKPIWKRLKKSRRKYDIESAEKNCEFFLEHMNVEQAMSGLLFFLIGVIGFTEITMDCFKQEKTQPTMTDYLSLRKKYLNLKKKIESNPNGTYIR